MPGDLHLGYSTSHASPDRLLDELDRLERAYSFGERNGGTGASQIREFPFIATAFCVESRLTLLHPPKNKQTMKLILFLTVASVAVMVVMVTQVVRQEISKNTLKVLARDTAAETLVKEKAIAELKGTVLEIRAKYKSMTQLTREMKEKKERLENEKKTLVEKMNTCNKEKDEVEKTKSETTENLNKQKAEHDEAKQTAQETIQDLKQSNLDREEAICALIDTTNADARKLCGLPPQ